MGCDIHLHVEVKIKGKWLHYNHPNIDRCYWLFTKMAGVREIEGVEACEGLPPSGNGCMVPRLEIVDVEAALAETPYLRRKFTFRGIVARTVQHEIDHLMGTFFVDRVSEPRRKSVLQKFNSWKEMRRAQIRKTEENGNVNTGAIAVYRS